MVSLRLNEEPSVQGDSTGPGYKARPFLIQQKSFPIDQNNIAYHPVPVSPPCGDGSPFEHMVEGKC